MFQSSNNLFKKWIDKWIKLKIQAEKDENFALRTICKLMLNNLYGKFALNPNVRSKIPYLGDDGIIHYKLGEEEKREPIYIPVGVFIIIMSGENTIFLSALSADLFAVETDVNFPVVKFAVSVDSFPLSAFIFKTVAQGNAGRSAV